MIFNPVPFHLRHQNSSFSALDSQQSGVVKQGCDPMDHSERRKSWTQKRVRFCPRVLVHETLHKNDYSKSEMTSVWYSARDLDAMRRHFKDELRKVLEFRRLNPQNSNRYIPSLPGAFLAEASNCIDRLQNRRNGQQAVFSLQSIQRQQLIHDEHSIAAAYMSATKQCGETAYKTALAMQHADTDGLEKKRTSLSSTGGSYKVLKCRRGQVGNIFRVFQARNTQ